MLITGQFRMNSNVNRTTERAPFDLILRFRPEIRMNIEAAEIKNSHNALKEVPAARREIELKKKITNLVRDIWDISQITAKKYYNIYKKEISFAIRDKILINVKNLRVRKLMEELHTDSIDGGHEASYGLGYVPGRGRTPTLSLEL
jgi:hypothetical protein